MWLEQFRLSEAERNDLITLKRRTGLKNWNVVCRWALCLSLAEETEPAAIVIQSDSTLEMTWKTFGGEWASVYRGIIMQRCLTVGLEPTDENLTLIFRRHLNRGISYMRGRDDIKGFAGLAAAGIAG